MKYLALIVLFFGCGAAENTSNSNEKSLKSNVRLESEQVVKDGWIDGDSINLDNLNLQKPVLVYFWTTWCKGCKQSEEWYFNKPEVFSILSANYHLVKVNGDSTKIILRGKEYGNSEENSYKHELNLAFGRNWFGYPNILVFNKDLEFLKAFEPHAFLGAPSDQFIPILDSVLSI